MWFSFQVKNHKDEAPPPPPTRTTSLASKRTHDTPPPLPPRTSSMKSSDVIEGSEDEDDYVNMERLHPDVTTEENHIDESAEK